MLLAHAECMEHQMETTLDLKDRPDGDSTTTAKRDEGSGQPCSEESASPTEPRYNLRPMAEREAYRERMVKRKRYVSRCCARFTFNCSH